MSFTDATPNGPRKTKTDVWLTPKWGIDAIGVSDLDPCGWLINGHPIVKTANHYFTEEEDGLKQDWSEYDSVFVNFPYSDAKNWMVKCNEHGRQYGNLIVLCFARTDTQWFQNNVLGATGMSFINRRISFLNENGVQLTNGNAPSVLIAWGDEAYQRIRNVDGIMVTIDR